MATHRPQRDPDVNKVPDKNEDPDKNDTALEKAIKYIDPPGHEVTDDDLNDPGRMTPGAPPTDNRT